MYNYFLTFGRIQNDPTLIDLPDGKKVVNMLIGVQRSFKNSDGNYDYDTLKVSFWDFLADYANNTFKKGRYIGLKGRIAPQEVEIEGGKKAIYHNLVCERVFFYEYGEAKEFPIFASTEEES